MKITSMHNDLVKYWVSLKTKKVRDKERKFIVEGDHLINEARKNNLIEYIISCVDENADYFVTKEIMEKIRKKNIIRSQRGKNITGSMWGNNTYKYSREMLVVNGFILKQKVKAKKNKNKI